MTAGRRIALLAAVVVIAVVGFIVLKPDEGSKKQSSPPTTADRTPTRAPAPPSVEVSGGKPVGGVKKLEFAKGDTVRFKVTSDVADEVHVHGYDLMKDVAPGEPVSFSFEADKDGEFEVELEEHGEEIANLVVQP